MNPRPPNEAELHRRIEEDSRLLKKAERERGSLLAQTIYLGTLGLVFVLPIIGGAYLGRWLDGLSAGYSLRWTLSLIAAGLVAGAFNVYFLIRSRE